MLEQLCVLSAEVRGLQRAQTISTTEARRLSDLDQSNVRNFLLARSLVAASLLAYCISLWMPAFEVLTSRPETTPGYELLILGWTSVVLVRDESLFLCFAWFANLAFLRTCLALRAGRSVDACASAAIGVVLAASFMLAKQTRMSGACELHPIKLHAGYFLWVASMVLALVASITILRREEGVNMLALHTRGISKFCVVAAVYLVLGLSLPIGECSLIESVAH